MKLKNQNILLTSNEPWGDLWYSKHNFAYELSKKNKVFFLNPPIKWKPKNLIINPITKEKYSENLSIINYQNYLPILNNNLNELNNLLVSRSLKRYFHRQKIKEYILWAFDQYRLYTPKVLGAKYCIYHCADHCSFKVYGEKLLCNNSDLMICVSQNILDFYNEIEKPKYVIPHGISSEDFETDISKESDLDIEIENYGLFAGVVDARLDFELFEKAVVRFPKETFLFVGPLRLPENQAAKRLFIERRYNNVITIGTRPFKRLKYYIKKSKFCISFMEKNYPGNKLGHHKTWGYLSQGKPVFGPIFSDYINLSHLMYMDDSHEGLLQKLSVFLEKGEDKTLRKKRINVAKTHSFENLLTKISNIVHDQTPNLQ